jgi:o-succinylbenzoate---CoA ligase
MGTIDFQPHHWPDWQQRLKSGWLLGVDSSVTIASCEQKLNLYGDRHLDRIVIQGLDPVDFITDAIAASCLEIPIFFANPHWGKLEYQQLEKMLKSVDRSTYRDKIMIPTGGSSGGIKLAVHTWQTLGHSVAGFREFYQVDRINCVCVLPLYHVSGWLQVMRSLLSGGQLAIASYHDLLTAPEHYLPEFNSADYFISLVPTQLEKLLDDRATWLAGFGTVLLGGAPASLGLLDRARSLGIPVALTYGMTETGSQICSLKPAEFLAGNHSCGRVLPHAQIEIINQKISITSSSLMWGYYPLNSERIDRFDPDDFGQIDENGYLSILGRNSDKIITGGEKVFASEINAAILASGLVKDVYTIGIPDVYWGELVVAIYEPIDSWITGELLKSKLAGSIGKYKLPKYWISIDKIPRNPIGKIEIEKLREIAIEFHHLNLNASL